MIKLNYGDFLKGDSYDDQYNNCLRAFQTVAETPNNGVVVENAPIDWWPLLHYLGAHSDSFGHVSGESLHGRFDTFKRQHVESSCTQRPLLVDALWRADMRWKGDRRHQWENAFPIATYSAFWRPEILKFMELVAKEHKPKRDRCILVPCSAHKPYPSKLHKAILGVVGYRYEMIVTSSAVGVAPEDFWDRMPDYDAGLPYFDRVRETVKKFFMDRHYSRIINYTDMLQWDIQSAVAWHAAGIVDVPVPFPERCDYQDLASPENLEKLRKVVQ